MNKGILFVISAPSGAGKTTILNMAMDILRKICFSVSHTTRAPRNNEKDSRDYFFIDSDKFEEMRKKGDFFEYANVHGNWYGTSKNSVKNMLAQGSDVVLDIDVQGFNQLKKQVSKLVSIFIVPPTIEELRKRLETRNSDSEQVIETRLINAKKELEEEHLYDYLIINDVLETAVETLVSVIIAERSKQRRSKEGIPLTLNIGISPKG
jgi:guanylate kinase